MAIFLDLAKAFDSINHPILLEKLKFYGIRNSSYEWFKNYLTDRKQFTMVNKQTSTYKTITHGVPQGSVLGPLLFLFFINDFPLCSELMKFTIFADDTNSVLNSNDIVQLRELAQTELQNISDWLSANKIKANLAKTHFILFKGKRYIDFSLRLTFEGKTLPQRTSSKMLGVIIDEKLKWSEHIIKVNAKVSRAIGILKKFSKILPINTLKLIYHSIIHPHLQYCNVIWGNASKSLLTPLFRSQKRAVRRISQVGYLEPTNDLFKTLKILKIQDLNKLETAKFVHKDLSKPNPKYFTRRRNEHHMVLRHINEQTLHLLRPNSERERKFILYHGAKIWNDLSHAIQQVRNPVTFKIKMKKHLINQY